MSTGHAKKVSIMIGSDHGGFEYKKEIIGLLKEKQIDIEDVGNFTKESSDYPDLAVKVAQAVSDGKADKGILVCGSGIGMSIVANKFPRVRAALVHNVETAKLSRLHNNANILILGERVSDPRILPEILNVWLGTDFEGGRHQRRLDKITTLEEKLYKK